MARVSRSGPKHASEGSEVKLLCYTCDRETVHRVVRAAEYQGQWEDENMDVTSWDVYQVVECRGCESLGFRKTHQNTEEYDNDPDTGEQILDTHQELFPNRLAGRKEIDHDWTLPRELLGIYRETLSAMRGAMPVLAGIGIRAIVETVCKDRKAVGANLEKRIDALVTQGVLTKEGAEVLHGLRILGNEAAHEVKPHSMLTLGTAMDVIDHLLMGVYVIPARASKLPKR
jgi:hypothetical protein